MACIAMVECAGGQIGGGVKGEGRAKVWRVEVIISARS